jgi:hypothetical protein
MEEILKRLDKINNDMINGFTFINNKFEHLEFRIDSIEDSLKSNKCLDIL